MAFSGLALDGILNRWPEAMVELVVGKGDIYPIAQRELLKRQMTR
jgi:hypothetical protein